MPRPRATRRARQRERLLLRLLRDGPGRVLLVAALDLGADTRDVAGRDDLGERVLEVGLVGRHADVGRRLGALVEARLARDGREAARRLAPLEGVEDVRPAVRFFFIFASYDERSSFGLGGH